jgi:hypothetical protein
VDAASDFVHLQPRLVNLIQRRYELIRPLVLLNEGTPAERAQATNTHPDTVRTFLHRFQTQGMLGLGLHDVDVVPHAQPHRVSEAVRQEIARLKALYPGFHYRELARILFCTFGYRMHHRTVQHHWEQSPIAAPHQLDLWPYHLHPDRAHARLQSNWLRVFRSQKRLAAVMREANRGIRERGGQKNAWHSRTDVGQECA